MQVSSPQRDFGLFAAVPHSNHNECEHIRLSSELTYPFTFLQVHEDSWPFLLPVNTKQFPTYRKVIKYPMDLSTIKKRLQDMV